MDDPFDVLGLGRDASLADVRAARRRLAFDRHPDRGGSAEAMRDLNAAFDAAVGHLTGRRRLEPQTSETVPSETRPSETGPSETRPAEPASTHPPATHVPRQRWLGRLQQDVPSFVIDALPAEAFEALLVVTSWIGEVLVDDPPYVLEVHLYEPVECWCRLDLVPDAGASTVSLTVAGAGTSPPPLLDDVRDLWVQQLNLPGAFG